MAENHYTIEGIALRAISRSSLEVEIYGIYQLDMQQIMLNVNKSRMHKNWGNITLEVHLDGDLPEITRG